MRKLSEPRKALILLIAFICLLIIVLIIGAIINTPRRNEPNEANRGSMLIVIGTGKANGNEYTIVYDRETKVEYMLTDYGLYPLYDVWGRFKTYEIPQ